MKIHVEVFWVVTPRIDVVGYQRFGETYRLHLQGEDFNLKTVASLHGVITQKTTTQVFQVKCL